MVDLALDGRVGQDFRRLLEGGSGEPGLGGKGRLGDAHEDETVGRRLEVRLAGVNARLYGGVGVFELEYIDDRAGQQVRVARLLDLDLAHHLADDDLDVLFVDVDALLTVHGENALRQIVLHGLNA